MDSSSNKKIQIIDLQECEEAIYDNVNYRKLVEICENVDGIKIFGNIQYE